MTQRPASSDSIKPIEVSDADLGIEPPKPTSESTPSSASTAPASTLLIHRQALPKDEVASDKSSSFESVAWAAEHALTMRALSGELRGMGGISGVVLLAVTILLSYLVLPRFVTFFFATFMKGDFFGLVFDLALLVGLLGCILGGITAAIYTFRNELQTPLDLPIVFNRKTRQMHVIAWDGGTKDWNTLGDLWRKWLSVFQRKRSEHLVYDWDSIEAHYQRETGATGNTPKIVHSLRLVARVPKDGQLTQDTILIGNTLTHSEDTVKMQWEWLRRYMQEGGPVLCPGDKPAPALPNSLWQSLLVTNPVWFISLPLIAYFGWWFYSRWDFSHAFMGQKDGIDGWFIVYALLAGFMLSWTFFNWLAHKVAPRLGDLPELRKDAGAPVELVAQPK